MIGLARHLALSLLLILATAGCVGWSISREFFAGQIGAAPASIVVVSGKWEVARAEGLADGMPALAQAEGDAPAASVCLLEGATLKEGALQVQLRTSKATGSGGGLVWAARGAIWRACLLDPARERLRVVEVVDGIEREVISAIVPWRDGWRTLRVDIDGDDVRCQLDGAELLACELDDSAEGGVGLWCAPAATALFADFAVIARR